MLGSFAAALVLAASVSHVAAGPINLVARNYAKDAALLEDYTPYHVRYLALDCHEKHDTTFFHECCHPLLRSQKLADRPKHCVPSPSAVSSAALAEPTTQPIDEEPLPEECDENTDEDPKPKTSVVYSPPPTTTTAKETTYTPQPTTSSEKPAYHPPTTVYEPTSTHETTSAEPTHTSKPETGNGHFITGGFATFFEQGGRAGACGQEHSDGEFLVAVDFRKYGNIDKVSSLCGKKVRVINTDNKKEVIATVTDVCPSCVNESCLDLSLGAYDQLGARDTGMLPIKYEYLD